MTEAAKPWHRYYDQSSGPFHPERLLAGSMAELIERACAEHGDQLAYSCCLPNGAHASLRFSEIETLSAALAFFLRDDLGLQPGDVVAIQAPNVLGYPVAAFAVMRAGLILTGINPLYTVSEANYQLKDSGAKALFILDLFGDKLAQSLKDTDVRHVIRLSVADQFPTFKRLMIQMVLRHVQKRIPPMAVPSISLAEAIKRGHKKQAGRDAAVLTADRKLDDVAIFQYTGGTTGRSKGAELTERNLLANITQQDTFNGARLRALSEGQETSLLILPLYHVYALAIGAMHAMRSGTHMVLAPNPRPLSNLRSAFEQFEISMLPGINTLFNELLKQEWFTENPPASLRWCFSGAAPLSESTRLRWEKLTGCRIYEGYGLTEGTCIVSSSPLDGSAKPGTVGVPIPGTDIRIVDDAGTLLELGESGEILVRGPQVMRGYLGRPDATKETIRDGWLYTGDIGRLDEDGFLTILDRKKDMLIVSGFNVYPSDIEEVIQSHDAVLEAAVVGILDDRTGEAPVAYVVPRVAGFGEDDIRRHCEDYLTNYKRPRHYVLVEELPKSPVGKVLRRTLREEARQHFGADKVQ
ncbi:long-chain-fatty-acid--CoA ligase [Iodidimonas muriae]|uniref:Long-chain-fatty-acid--CoA ligase n=1 Tax=Iodidimonas muriae TaxID=261467 RepID=A0ABQ2LCX9_9PROT|nr:long-chain fatty acid--CoA ligase [Iodidimonas muriae]GER07262.1 long-chain-fatty-acid--CoA ligase [Kordiimonadales bacterium JCM 17843]GGO11238.1 long-chain-fatty-acid--CoA ligase [Iodidimonas muriae]